MMTEQTIRMLSSGLRKVRAFLRPFRQQLIDEMVHFGQGQAAGWRILDSGYEAPEYRMTLDIRQRQLHDEDKSCGIQPAYIRVIYRRLSAAVLTRSAHYSKGGYKKSR